MSTQAKSVSASPRLTGYAVSSLWHRRLARTQPSATKVQPRVSAELILHPVVSHGLRVDAPHLPPCRPSLDACHAA